MRERASERATLHTTTFIAMARPHAPRGEVARAVARRAELRAEQARGVAQQVEREPGQQRNAGHVRETADEELAETETALEVGVGKLGQAGSRAVQLFRLGGLHARAKGQDRRVVSPSWRLR